jgi:hypothetical protein
LFFFLQSCFEIILNLPNCCICEEGGG